MINQKFKIVLFHISIQISEFVSDDVVVQKGLISMEKIDFIIRSKRIEN